MSTSHRRRPQWIALTLAVALVAVVASGCQKKEEPMSETPDTSLGAPAEGQPAAAADTLPAGHIEVQHVLVGFQGSVPGKPITRTQEEARKLAYEILERARKGEDFGQLVQQYTDDQYPGIYRLADNGVQAEQGVEFARSGMVPGFGDAAFALERGGVGIADFDKQASPYGWHVIKRLR